MSCVGKVLKKALCLFTGSETSSSDSTKTPTLWFNTKLVKLQICDIKHRHTDGADQHIRSSLGFSVLPRDTWTCRPGELNLQPSKKTVSTPEPQHGSRACKSLFVLLPSSCPASVNWCSCVSEYQKNIQVHSWRVSYHRPEVYCSWSRVMETADNMLFKHSEQ